MQVAEEAHGVAVRVRQHRAVTGAAEMAIGIQPLLLAVLTPEVAVAQLEALPLPQVHRVAQVL
jgi:hypothetical protein